MKQVIFLAVFGLLCSVFVFFVPWGASPAESEETTSSEQLESAEVSDFSSDEKPSLTGEFWILADPKVSVSVLSGFTDAFFKQRGIRVRYKEISDLEFSGTLAPADLYLLPYDLLSGFSLQKL